MIDLIATTETVKLSKKGFRFSCLETYGKVIMHPSYMRLVRLFYSPDKYCNRRQTMFKKADAMLCMRIIVTEHSQKVQHLPTVQIVTAFLSIYVFLCLAKFPLVQ